MISALPGANIWKLGMFNVLGVQIFILQYFYMCITNTTGCPFTIRASKRQPKVIAG